MTRLLEEVALAIVEVAAEVLEPAFARREELQPWEKSVGEVVTTADVEAERRLGLRLAELHPGVPMVGEESTGREPTLPAKWLAEAPRVWLVDPLDGTANFVAGSHDWAVMVALVEHGVTRFRPPPQLRCHGVRFRPAALRLHAGRCARARQTDGGAPCPHR